MIPPRTRSCGSCGSANASTRATLAVTCGPSGAAAGGEREKGEAEQKLLDKALDSYPHLFTSRPDLGHGQEFPRRAPDLRGCSRPARTC